MIDHQQTISHRDGCKGGARWLKHQRHANRILIEPRCSGRGKENPDVVGLEDGELHVIEVKVSRADFLRDAEKACRNVLTAMGTYRWYLVPPGVCEFEELPDGWGLLRMMDDGAIESREEEEAVRFRSTLDGLRAERDMYAQEVTRELFAGDQQGDRWDYIREQFNPYMGVLLKHIDFKSDADESAFKKQMNSHEGIPGIRREGSPYLYYSTQEVEA